MMNPFRSVKARRCLKVLVMWIPIQLLIVFVVYGTLKYRYGKLISSTNKTSESPQAVTLAAAPRAITSSRAITPDVFVHKLTQHPDLHGVLRRIEAPDIRRGILYEETLFYPKYDLHEPRFICDEDRSIFWKLPSNVEALGIPSSEKLLGKLYVIRNGTFQLPYDCGYRSDVSFVMSRRNVPPSNWFRRLIPMIVPNGNTYQHFQDGTMPKIMQVRHFLRNPDTKLLLERPRDAILFDLLNAFNISKQVVWSTYGQAYGADNLIFTCNTPPLHPSLWYEARRAAGAPEVRKASWDDGDVVYITRSGCFNCGRTLLNFEPTMALLRSRYSKHLRIFNGPYPLNTTIDFFKNAKIIIGTHGGGLSNVQFCPVNTTLIEIMPQYKATGKDFVIMGRLMWTQAYLLGLKYWRIAAEPVDSKGNVNVNLTKLTNVLDTIEKERT